MSSWQILRRKKRSGIERHDINRKTRRNYLESSLDLSPRNVAETQRLIGLCELEVSTSEEIALQCEIRRDSREHDSVGDVGVHV